MAERRRKPDYVHGDRTWENTRGYFKHKNEGSKEMNQNETQWDKLLKIKTTGRDDSHSDQYRYPYEPTSYMVLERLANSGLIRKNNTLIDYGTGKGRVCFYLSYQTRCKTIGVEYDERIYKGAADNKEVSVFASRTEFVLCSAENYEVPSEVIAVTFLILFL